MPVVYFLLLFASSVQSVTYSTTINVLLYVLLGTIIFLDFAKFVSINVNNVAQMTPEIALNVHKDTFFIITFVFQTVLKELMPKTV